MMAATTSRWLELGVSNPSGMPAPAPAAGRPAAAEVDGLTLLASVPNGDINPPRPPNPPPPPPEPLNGIELIGIPPPPAPRWEYCRERSIAANRASRSL